MIFCGQKEDVTAPLRAPQAAVSSLTHSFGGAGCQGRKEAPREQVPGGSPRRWSGGAANRLRLLTRDVRWGEGCSCPGGAGGQLWPVCPHQDAAPGQSSGGASLRPATGVWPFQEVSAFTFGK